VRHEIGHCNGWPPDHPQGKGRTMREAVVIACVLLAGPAGGQDNIFEVLKNAHGGFYVLKDVPTEFRGRWCLYGKSDAKKMSEYFGRPLLEVTYRPCTPGARPHLVIAYDTLDIGPGPFYACHVDRVGLLGRPPPGVPLTKLHIMVCTCRGGGRTVERATWLGLGSAGDLRVIEEDN
jgi:hypothetical protein